LISIEQVKINITLRLQKERKREREKERKREREKERKREREKERKREREKERKIYIAALQGLSIIDSSLWL